MPPHEPQRRCILTGSHGTRDGLIRLALGPDGAVAPDLAARAPGRGAWITPSRDLLARSQAKGKLKAALARAFKTGALTVPDDLAGRIAAGLEARALDRIGLENRAGHIILGSERIASAIDAGRVAALLHAIDAGEDGERDLTARLARKRPDAPTFRLPAEREALSRALGRANVVHVAINESAAAKRVLAAVERWRAFNGLSSGTPAGHSREGGPLSTLPAPAGHEGQV